MGRRETAERHGQLLRDLHEERAAALLRISRRLESLIDQMRQVRVRIANASADSAAADRAKYRELRREALRHRWYLEVQREALGLRHHALLDEFYRIPDPISRAD